MSSIDEELNEYEMLKEELDRPIKTLGELATIFCIVMECKNCPVHIENYDKRTEFEKCCLHEPCVSNLYKWIVDKVKRDILDEYVGLLKSEYSVLQSENPKICENVFNRFEELKEQVLKDANVCKTTKS